MDNYILMKDSACTVFSYRINNEINIYFINKVLPLPLGKFNEISEDYTEWIKLPANLFLPLLKNLAGTNDKDEKGKSTGVANAAKRLYDYFLDKEKILRNQPALIRKVLDIDTAICSLAKQTIKFTPRDEFNDIQEGYVRYYEGCPAYTLIKDTIERKLNEEMEKYRIACFAEGPWNNLALSLYGNKGNGVLFIFNAEKLSKQLNQELSPIKYRYNPPKCSADNIPVAALEALKCKHISWEYEKEWRYIMKKDELKALQAQPMKNSKSLLWEFKMDALEKILVGPRVCDDKWMRLRCIVYEKNKSNPDSHVKIQKLGVDRSEYNSLPISCP